jgi:4-alpha-glucanotransferase
MNSSSSSGLHDLAYAAGVARRWRDVDGRETDVEHDALKAILLALGHQSSSSRQIKNSLAALADGRRHMPPMLVTEVGLATPVDGNATQAEVTGEDGITRRIMIDRGLLAPIDAPGYYDLSLDGLTRRLAVAPRHCPLPDVKERRMWGTSVQIPALRGTIVRAFGGFGELTAAAQTLGRAGCDALAINPVHALFPGVGDDYSPYSPSSRTFLNTAMGDPAVLDLPAFPEGEAKALIDWPTAMPRRLVELRHVYSSLNAEHKAQIRQASEAEGPALRRHAIFDALDCHFRPEGAKGWQDWPFAYQKPDGLAVQRFAREHADDIEFHLFAQWLAREGLHTAQLRSREAGMAIGLIADLAVGVHTGGSDTWAMPDAMLKGLTIGAPPDPLGPLGQNWSITGFSPSGLRARGYQPWIDMRAVCELTMPLVSHGFGSFQKAAIRLRVPMLSIPFLILCAWSRSKRTGQAH